LVEEGLEVAAGERTSKSYAPITPVSLQSLHKNGEDATETDDQEVHEMPVKSKLATSLKDRRRPQSKPKAKSTRRKTVVSSEEEESSLSNLSSTSEDEDTLSSEATSGNGSVPQLKDLGSLMRRSPQVVISPPKKATPGQGRKPASRPLTKATPTRSPYFDHSDRTGDDSEDDESDREVVKPRQTTARTKARR
jgi:xeroderma pigmentosum group C-complementing protein